MFLSDGVDPKSQHVFLQAKGSAPKAGFFLVLKYSLSLKYIQLYMYFELYVTLNYILVKYFQIYLKNLHSA